MRISQRLDYVLRALVEMARLPQGTMVVAGDLARRLGLPKRFLEQQLTILGKHGVMSCQRGAGGGCALAKAPEEISVAEVVKAIQGEIIDVPRTRDSAVAEMWGKVARRLAEELGDITLRQLVLRQEELEEAGAPMYHI